jgi:nucleotide-binding universal stress UspA family protein
MSIRVAQPGVPGAVRTGRGGPHGRILVVYESCRAGAATLREAAERAAAGADLSVVTLAPQAKPYKCCGGGGPGPYNCAVREEAADDLREARELLGSVAGRARFHTLVGSPSPPLAAWAAAQDFDLILVPARRFTRAGGRLARGLRRATAADVRAIR